MSDLEIELVRARVLAEANGETLIVHFLNMAILAVRVGAHAA